MSGASDAAIWGFATRVAAVIVTKDEDFAQRKVLHGDGSGRAVDQAAEHAPARIAGMVRVGSAGRALGRWNAARP
jgi:hypothetical protein